MLEEKDLTSEERVRLECLELAVRSCDIDRTEGLLITRAKAFEKYIRGNEEGDN
jgi:hypothetical protein